MKYIIKCAHYSNPGKEHSQFFGILDLPNEEDDSLMFEIQKAMGGIRDCTFYFEDHEPLNDPNLTPIKE